MSKKEVLRVSATSEDIRESYGRISRFYGVVENWFERKARRRGLELLDPEEGEIILEIGFGTGCSTVEIAESVGEKDKVYGIDIAPQMVKLARKRLKRHGLADRVSLSEGDARNMPYKNGVFDAVYMACTLELFDTPDIPKVLKEIKRIISPEGRFGVVSLCKEGYEDSIVVRVYEWMHKLFPKYANCRPIYLVNSVTSEGYKIIKEESVRVGGLMPMKIVIARPQ